MRSEGGHGRERFISKSRKCFLASEAMTTECFRLTQALFSGYDKTPLAAVEVSHSLNTIDAEA